MVGKRVTFGDETWAAVNLLRQERRRSFQQLADEAFADLLHKHHRPADLKSQLRESTWLPPLNRSRAPRRTGRLGRTGAGTPPSCRKPQHVRNVLRGLAARPALQRGRWRRSGRSFFISDNPVSTQRCCRAINAPLTARLYRPSVAQQQCARASTSRAAPEPTDAGKWELDDQRFGSDSGTLPAADEPRLDRSWLECCGCSGRNRQLPSRSGCQLTLEASRGR